MRTHNTRACEEILAGCEECVFCIVSFSELLDPGRDLGIRDDFSHFTIEAENEGIRPPRRKYRPHGHRATVKALSIRYRRRNSGHVLKLRPCTNPVLFWCCKVKNPLSAFSWKSRPGYPLVERQADIRLLQRWL